MLEPITGLLSLTLLSKFSWLSAHILWAEHVVGTPSFAPSLENQIQRYAVSAQGTCDMSQTCPIHPTFLGYVRCSQNGLPWSPPMNQQGCGPTSPRKLIQCFLHSTTMAFLLELQKVHTKRKTNKISPPCLYIAQPRFRDERQKCPRPQREATRSYLQDIVEVGWGTIP